nr:structural maintenance of chromosomes protein 6-like isoform X2 [Dermatophagoides pteronyssinus]XP_027198295.1 structural maintenance of chromosomes protein 6-like isoform X2 [Dermatophagoides pteronyssinus]
MPLLTRTKRKNPSINQSTASIVDSDLSGQIETVREIEESDENEIGSPLKIARFSNQKLLAEKNNFTNSALQHTNQVPKSDKKQTKSDTFQQESIRSSDIDLDSGNISNVDDLFDRQDENSNFNEQLLDDEEPIFNDIDNNNNDDEHDEYNPTIDSNRISEQQISTYKNTLTANTAFNSNQNYVTGEIGHIREIQLKNFMCHKNFRLEFGPRINFIVGQNGSGKSAILIGIVLCLGGRASSTNRGSGLSSFIKNGESRAQIILKIANFIEGQSTKEESYKYDRYGKSIIIERTININGSSSYKLKSEKGSIVSEKKEELDNILAHLGIFYDNPICILTQEVSKNFLNSKSVYDKYKFFIKATQIEETKQSYQNCLENHGITQKIITEKNELLKSYKAQLEKYRGQVETVEMLRNNVSIMKRLNDEEYWACINETRKELDEKKAKLNVEEKSIETNADEIFNIKREIDEIIRQKEELDERLKNFGSIVKQMQNDLQEAKNDADQMSSQLVKKEAEVNTVKREINIRRSEINDISEKIAYIEKNSQDCPESSWEERIQKLNEELNNKKFEQDSLKSKLAELQQHKDEYDKEKVRFKEEVQKNQINMDVCQREIKRLTGDGNNRLRRYGAKFSELNEKIDLLYKNKKFHRKPFGPIGEYIRLNDSKDAYAVECLLKKMLYAYVVDNNNDANILKDLISRLFTSPTDMQNKPTIIIRKYVPLHDVSRSQATSTNYKNFLQLMNIKNEDYPVANCLIDHLKIEQILYIPKFSEAQRVLSRRELVPRNCCRGYTSDGDVMFPSTNRSDYKCYPNKNPNKFARILVRDSTTTIEHYKNQINDLKRKSEELYREQTEHNGLIEDNKKEIALIRHKINQCDIDLHNMESKRSEMEAKAAIRPVEAVALKEEVLKLEEERKEFENQLQELTNERNGLKDQYNDLLNKSIQKQREYKKLSESRDPMIEQIEELNDKQKNLLDRSEIKANDQQILLQSKLKLEHEIEVYEKKLHEEEVKALEVTETPIETTRSSAEIQKELKRMQSMIQVNEHLLDPKVQEQIYKSYNELSNSICGVENELDNINEHFVELKKSTHLRRMAYQNMLIFIARLVNIHFHEFLKQKEFVGRIDINFNESSKDNDKGKGKSKAKTLDLIIKPRISSKNSQHQSNNEIQSFSSTKSLSGGERSFSTVAFIISLWQICQSPFKILDEVDVFMDMVTRQIALDSLVEFAASKSSKQFIFLSPLSLQQFNHSEFIKISQMPEPERK